MSARENVYHQASRQYATGYQRGLYEAIAACRQAVPRAHTYASENADIYRAGDAARDACINAIETLVRGEKPK